MADTQTEYAEILPDLAALAKAGLRAVLLLGKVKSIRPVTSEKSGLQQMKAEVICSEGETMTLKWPMGVPVPGVQQECAFVIDKPTEYMNKASANCIAFA